MALAIYSVPSPNFSSRNGHAVLMLVLHATVGSMRSSRNWLTKKGSKVSCHYLIGKDGRIEQLVNDRFASWHAGDALWSGIRAVNESSLGIELENKNDGRDPYPKAQLESLVELSRLKVKYYSIQQHMVARHFEVALPAGRKTDPAGFPWAWYIHEVFGTLPATQEWRWYKVRWRSVRGANIRLEPDSLSLDIGDLWPWSKPFLGRATTGQKVNNDPLWIERPPEQGGGFVHWSNLELLTS